MGIKGLLKQLPGGERQLRNFSSLSGLKDRSSPVDLDAGGLAFVCALRHRQECEQGNYLPAVKEFRSALMLPFFVDKWDLACVFDGVQPKEKRFEHARRRGRSGGGGSIVTNAYISLLVKFCRDSYIPFIMAVCIVGGSAEKLSPLTFLHCIFILHAVLARLRFERSKGELGSDEVGAGRVRGAFWVGYMQGTTREGGDRATEERFSGDGGGGGASRRIQAAKDESGSARTDNDGGYGGSV